MCVSCPTYLIFLYSVTLSIFGEQNTYIDIAPLGQNRAKLLEDDVCYRTFHFLYYVQAMNKDSHTERLIRSTSIRLRSRVSSVSIVSDYGLDDRAIGVRSPAGAKDFSSNPCVQTGSGAHPASCTMGTGGPFPGGKSAAGA
jgi:hypothetical protein